MQSKRVSAPKINKKVDPAVPYDPKVIGDKTYTLGKVVGQTGFESMRSLQHAFDLDHAQAQERLLKCVYYATGNMHGIRKLYDKIKRIDVDEFRKQLRVGDTVKFKSRGLGSNVLGVVIGFEYLTTDQQAFKRSDLIAPAADLTVGDSVVVRKGRLQTKVVGVKYVLARKSLGKVFEKTYDREELLFVHGITREMVTDFLMRQEVYQLGRRPLRVKSTKGLVPSGPRSIIQLDLIGPFTKKGVCGFRHAMVVLDIFTRKAYTEQLKDTKAKGAGRAFVKILDRMAKSGKNNKFENVKTVKGKRRVLISSDGGPEFGSEFWVEVEKWFQSDESVELGLEFEHVVGIPGVPTSQAYVERVNQTIKGLLYKMLHTHKQKCFSSFLQRATSIYNDSMHSAIKMTPNDAENADRTKVRNNLIKTLQKVHTQSQRATEKRTLKVGDYVRVIQNKGAIDHRYYDNWREPIFKVSAVLRAKSANQVIRYELDAFEAVDEPLISAKGKKFKYKRNMLLHVPEKVAEAPPESMSTFKQWCNVCESNCLDYKAFLAAAELQKKQKKQESSKQGSSSKVKAPKTQTRARKTSSQRQKLGSSKGFVNKGIVIGGEGRSTRSKTNSNRRVAKQDKQN